MMKVILNTSYAVATFVALLILSSPANADIIKHAGNGCFPRVFSQIDQFKISTGGLRNTHPNPRTIICSVDNDATNGKRDADDGTRGAQVTVYADESALGMTCTFQARGVYQGNLIDSVTRTATAIDFLDFGGIRIGDIDWLFTVENDVYLYLQCVLPGNARIFSYSVNFEHFVNDP